MAQSKFTLYKYIKLDIQFHLRKGFSFARKRDSANSRSRMRVDRT